MLTIEPRPESSMPGRNARSVRCIDFTLRSNEKSQSSSEHSRTVPWCTKLAALSRMSTLPTRLAVALTAAVSRTSSRATSDTPSLASWASRLSSISVAKTVAPSRAKANAQARPIPAAPAVTNARLPLRRSPIYFSLDSTSALSANARCHRPNLPHMKKINSLRSPNDGLRPRLLMIVPGHADLAGDVLIAGGEFHAGAGGMLADGRAIQLLPGCLVSGVRKAALGFQLGAPLLQLVIGYEDVGAALVQIDANHVPVFEDGKSAIGCGFRRRVEDGRRTGSAGLAAVADAGQREDAPFDQRGRRLHVYDLRAAGIADRAGTAHEQDATLVDIKGGVVDPRVIVLGPFEHDGAPLECVGVLWIDQIALAEFL